MTKTKTPKAGDILPTKDFGFIANLASQMLNFPARPRLPSRGSRMRIWKQDPTTKIGVRDVYLHTRVRQGPTDSQIKIQGLPTVYPNIHGDFLFSPNSEDSFDAVHTYAVVRQVLTMFQRSTREKMKWQWADEGNGTAIDVFPHAGEAMNAYYNRSTKSLKFFYYRPPGSTDDFEYTCQSLDVVAHEVGHAVLDSIRPEWWVWPMPAEIGGLHESFGDLTAIFLILSQFDQVEHIVAETKGNLHKRTVLKELAEQFGKALGRPYGLRNADNNLKLSEVVNNPEVHLLSNVFTGAVYDVLADAFFASRRPRWRDDAVVLYETGQKMLTMLTTAFKEAKGIETTFATIANLMIKFVEAHPEDYPNYAGYIRRQFARREVIGPNAIQIPMLEGGLMADFSGCCGTMQNLENDAVAIGKPKLHKASAAA